MTTYDSLKVEDKVRVNAAIIETFKSASPDDLNALRRLSYEKNPKEPAEGFQAVLDGMRNSLAGQLSTLPPTRDNGVDEKIDLSNQRQLLRTIKETMGQELSYVTDGDLKTGRYYSPEHYKNLTERYSTPEQDGPNSVTLGTLTTEQQMRALIEGSNVGLASDAKVCSVNIDDIQLQASQRASAKEASCTSL